MSPRCAQTRCVQARCVQVRRLQARRLQARRVQAKQPLFRLALACLCVASATGQRAGAPLAAITIYTDFQQPAPQAVAEAMRAEVESILAPATLPLEWRPLAEFRSETVSSAVVVAHFEGRCDVGGLAMRDNAPGSLGWTEISDGKILPFMHVDCARVRTFLQSTLLGYHSRDRERLYGRALGRVLAHELYHAIAVTREHGARGVAKEDYSVKDLLAASFPMHEKEIGALRAARPLAGLKVATLGP